MTSGKKIWTLSWRLAVCGLLMFWIFHAIFTKEGKSAVQRQGLNWEQLSRGDQWHQAWTSGPQELWHTLSAIEPWAFWASIGLYGVTIVLGFLRWRMVLRAQGLNLSVGRAAEISFVAHFFNSFLLGNTGGDLIKAYYAARETSHKKTEAVVTVFADRLIGLWAMLLFAGIMMIPNWGLLHEHDRLLAACALIGGMLLACTILAYVAFWGGVSRRWPKARELFRRLPKGEWLERSIDSCRQFGKERFLISRTLGISLAVNFFCVLHMMVLGLGMQAQVSLTAWSVIVPVVICISALPITPSGLGVRENLFVMMLAVPEINVPATTALSLSLLAFAGTLFWSLVGGIVYVTFKSKHHLDEVTEANGES